MRSSVSWFAGVSAVIARPARGRAAHRMQRSTASIASAPVTRATAGSVRRRAIVITPDATAADAAG